MTKLLKRKSKGSIAITTILVISSVLVAGGLSIAYSTMDYSRSLEGHNSVVTLRMKLDACFEEGLFKLKASRSYTGSYSINFIDGICNGTIINDSNNLNYKIINLSSTTKTFTQKDVRAIDISQIQLIEVKVTPVPE